MNCFRLNRFWSSGVTRCRPVNTGNKKPQNRRAILGFTYLVNPAGFEPATVCLEGRCSIQLSYESSPYLGVGNSNVASPNRIPKDPVLALSGRQDSNLRPSGPKPDALPPAPLPELNATFFFSGKTGTRTQGTLPRPQLSRLLHYHSATFPLGCANLYVKSFCARQNH